MLRNFTFKHCLSKRASAAVLCGAALVATPALAQERGLQSDPEQSGFNAAGAAAQESGQTQAGRQGQVQIQQPQPQGAIAQPQGAIGGQAISQQPGLGIPHQLGGQQQPGQQAQRGPQLGAQIEPHEDGVKVVRVRSESVAKEAGLKEGDIIKRFNDQEVSDIGMLQNQMNQVKSGDEVKLVVLREDEEETLTAKFEQDDRVSVARPALQDSGQAELESLRREVQQLREELNSIKQEHEAIKQEHKALKESKQELKENKEELKDSKEAAQQEAEQADASTDDNNDDNN